MTSAPYRLLRFSQPGSRQGGDLPLRVLRTLAVAFLLGFKSSLKATFYDSTVGVFFSSLGKPHKTFFHLGSLPLPTANMAVVFRKPTVTETQEQEAAERTRGSMREVRFYQIILVLASQLGHMTLVSLALQQNSMGDVGFQVLASALADAFCLEILDVGDNAIGEASCEAFATILRIPTLKELRADHNQLGDAGAKVAAACLNDEIAALELLSLADNHIGRDGLEAVAEIQGCQNRIGLRIGMNGDSGYVGRSFAEVLAQNASIKLLDPVVEHMMTDVMQAMQAGNVHEVYFDSNSSTKAENRSCCSCRSCVEAQRFSQHVPQLVLNACGSSSGKPAGAKCNAPQGLATAFQGMSSLEIVELIDHVTIGHFAEADKLGNQRMQAG
ncbi:Nlrc5 [Symbiodinium natans]|uniref:Nlrc5 protein n=1 Tax=Symbiodinium natans TaxID=878477 RepID=A0A812K6I2_9DINO|nr:Nlrc5 [Symbiodinium natans]